MSENTKSESATDKAVKNLAKDAMQFAKSIDCLQTMLPVLMHVMGYVRKDVRAKHTSFIEEHAIDKRAEGDSEFFTLNADDASSYNRLSRQRGHAETTYVLLPRHFITSLIAQYDSFLGKLIRFVFTVKPELLNSSDKSLLFTDLIQFTDITSARDYLIEKEVETVIRKNHADQFAWLKNKLGTPFNKNLDSWPQFIELTERRNLFVHCDGIISSQYLSVCKQHKCNVDPNSKVGDRLEVPNDYFHDACRCIFEIGIKLSQVIWRRLCPQHIEKADSNIIDITYDLIENRDYETAIRLLDYFTSKSIKHHSAQNRLMLVINRAQAYKWLKRKDMCFEILDQEDWSATQDQFKICVAALREDLDEVFKIMNRLRHDDDFHKAYYKDWPVFKELRKEEEFAAVYEQCYGEPFKIEGSTKSNDSTSAESMETSECSKSAGDMQ